MAQETQVRIYHFILVSNLPFLEECSNALVMLIPLVCVSLGQAVRWLGPRTGAAGGSEDSEPRCAGTGALFCTASPLSSSAAAPGRPLRWLFSSSGIGQDNKIITTWPLG